MGVMNPGRNLVLCSIVTSPSVKQSVGNGALASEIKRRLDSAGILTQGQPVRIPSPLLVVTTQSTLHLGWQRCDTSISIYTNSDHPIDTLEVSKVVSASWNAVTIAARNPNSLGITDGASTDRPLGNYQCPPGEVFEEGTREATLRWESGPLGNIAGFFLRITPIEEYFYQVRTVSSPVPVSGDIPRMTTGVVDSITTSNVTDSNVPSLVGTSTAEHQLPTMADVTNAAHSAGQTVNRTLSEAVSGVTGMGSGDIKVIAYATLGIVGALVFVKILKEVKAI